MSFTKLLPAAKFIIASVVGVGTGKIVKEIIKNNVSAPETLIDKATMASAAFVIGGIASQASKKYTNEMVDDGVQIATRLYTSYKHGEKLHRINRFESTFEKEGLDPTKYIKDDKDKWVAKKDTLTDKVNRVNSGETTVEEEGLQDVKLRQTEEGEWAAINDSNAG